MLSALASAINAMCLGYLALSLAWQRVHCSWPVLTCPSLCPSSAICTHARNTVMPDQIPQNPLLNEFIITGRTGSRHPSIRITLAGFNLDFHVSAMSSAHSGRAECICPYCKLAASTVTGGMGRVKPGVGEVRGGGGQHMLPTGLTCMVPVTRPVAGSVTDTVLRVR